MTRLPPNSNLTRAVALAVAVAATLCPAPLRAQTLVGLIFDAQSEAPVAGAEVTLVDGDRDLRSTSSDGAGSFTLLAPRAGEYRVRVSRLGYTTYHSGGIALSEGVTTQVRVMMGVDAIPLDPLTVLTEARAVSGPLIGFERRMEDPSLQGFYVTRDDIERRPAATPTQLVLTAPGITLQRIGTVDAPAWQDRSMIYLNGARGSETRPGNCLAQVYVNGMRMTQSPINSVDDMMAADNLAGVEVYPRASSAPPEFRGSGECGVVLFWLQETQSSDRGFGLKRILIGAGTILGLLLVGFSG